MLNHNYVRKSSFNHKIGGLLKSARKAKGLSQQQVAFNLKYMQQPEVSRIENGELDVKAETLLHFARLYDKPVSYFYQ